MCQPSLGKLKILLQNNVLDLMSTIVVFGLPVSWIREAEGIRRYPMQGCRKRYKVTPGCHDWSQLQSESRRAWCQWIELWQKSLTYLCLRHYGVNALLSNTSGCVWRFGGLSRLLGCLVLPLALRHWVQTFIPWLPRHFRLGRVSSTLFQHDFQLVRSSLTNKLILQEIQYFSNFGLFWQP